MDDVKTPEPSGFLPGFVIGAIVGLMVCGIVGGALAYAMVKKTRSDVQRGWNLVPVVIAERDLPAGSTLTFDDVAQRSIPEQLVTRSIVRPDNANYVIFQALSVPLAKGD